MEFVAASRDEHGVDPICAALRDTSAQIAPSTVRAHLSPQKTEAPRVVRDRELLTQVRAVHADNLGVYGAPETFFIDAKGVIRDKYVGVIDEVVWREQLAAKYQALVDEAKP